jgi:hypothetical protein
MVSTSALYRLLRLLHYLQDDPTKPEEGLARSTSRDRLLANAAQVQPRSLNRGYRAVEVGSDRHHVVQRRDPVGVHRLLARRRPIGPGGRQPIQLGALDIT